MQSVNVLVKPSDYRQVQALRQNFLTIARHERDTSKERDKDFMPEVRRCQNNTVVTGGGGEQAATAGGDRAAAIPTRQAA